LEKRAEVRTISRVYIKNQDKVEAAAVSYAYLLDKEVVNEDTVTQLVEQEKQI
jgi:hypothetical protein